MGSSPLTRGKYERGALEAGPAGLIPAHAGKMPASQRASRPSAAHPRSRGENVRRPAGARNAGGSSPLTRGKFETVVNWPRVVGLIPAHAGKISARHRSPASRRAHPRSRGENSTRKLMTRPSRGSSPLTRGKWLSAWSQCYLFGLIPAHAGKIAGLRVRADECRAHPRSRGENRLGHRRLRARRRLIPAHAGKIADPPLRRASVEAHPRSRGENTRSWPVEVVSSGSSPLTRGKFVEVAGQLVGGGLIPAHAGKIARTARPRAPRWAHPRSRGENGWPRPPFV